MNQRALRTVLLIQAIEETDRAGEVIPDADRADATRAAVRQSTPLPAAGPGAPLSRQSEEFLRRRAGILLARVEARSPAVAHVLAVAGGLTWMGRAVCIVAFAAGVSLAALDGSRRINILAFPLIGLIAWNLLVYIALLAGWMKGIARRPGTGLWSSTLYEHWISGRVEALMRHATKFNLPLTAGLRRFIREWSVVSRPVLILRAKRLMHFAALLLALGLVAGLYVRGVVLRYEAGWESTFLGPSSAHLLLEALYGPASLLSGIAVGSTEGIRALQWTAAGGGAGAAPWIHLIALTAGLYIVLPRLLLSLAATFGIWRFSRRPPVPASLLGYANSLIIGAGGGAVSEVAGVIAYAYEPDAQSLAGLETLVKASLGANFKVEARGPLRYGDEDAILSRPDAAGGWIVLLMSLASTPEVENHGRLIRGLRDRLAGRSSTSPLLLVVDEGPLAARMRGEAVFEQRLQERRKLWREFVAGYGLRACFVNLMQLQPGSEVENGLREAVRGAVWTGSGRA